MKILVTGANSLLGTNVLVELLQRNFEVRAMVRAKYKLLLSDPSLEVCLGDITDKCAVRNAVKGCDIVIHVAANTSQASVRYSTYEKVNVTGTKYIMDAVVRHQVKKIILVSSANAFAYGTLTNPGTEDAPISYPFSHAGYARSKYNAQQYVLGCVKNNEPDVVVVNPTFMLGKYDSKPGSGEIIIRGYKKKWIIVPPGGKNFIHVKDAAIGVCNAIHSGISGQCYLLANENMSYKAFYKMLIAITGQESRIILIPKWVLLLAGLMGSLLARMGIPVSAHYINMRILCVKNYYSNKKAGRVLDLPATPVSEAIKEAVSWFLEKGMLHEKK